MQYQRIEHVIDVNAMKHKCITVVGIGGSKNLCEHLVRCGLTRLKACEPDIVGPENPCRQGYLQSDIGAPKVQALGRSLLGINEKMIVSRWQRDFCSFTDKEIDLYFGNSDVFVFATDNHDAQARGNEVCLRLNKPGVWIGMYPEGQGGEVFFWKPGLASCYRCMLSARYEAQQAHRQDPPSLGSDILAISYLDSIAGMIILGLLTEGAENRYGKLIRRLGDRQFIQMKIDPDWKWNGRDVVKTELGVPDGNDAYFTWNAIARRDPDPGGNCLDCRRFHRSGGVVLFDSPPTL